MILGQRQMKSNYIYIYIYIYIYTCIKNKNKQTSPWFWKTCTCPNCCERCFTYFNFALATEVPQSANSCIWQTEDRVWAAYLPTGKHQTLKPSFRHSNYECSLVSWIETNLMWLAFLFHYLMLNMFRMLIHPSSGACDLFVELFHGLYCSGSMRVGVMLWFGWSTSASAYIWIPPHTIPAKPQRNTNTHRTWVIQPMK